jgi:hypothetical protein
VVARALVWSPAGRARRIGATTVHRLFWSVAGRDDKGRTDRLPR